MAAISLPTAVLDGDHFATALGGVDDTATVASLWTDGGIPNWTGRIVYDNRTALATSTAGGEGAIRQSRLQVLTIGTYMGDDAGDTVLLDANGDTATSTAFGDETCPWWATVRVLGGKERGQHKVLHSAWLWDLVALKAAVGAGANAWTDGSIPPISLPPATV